MSVISELQERMEYLYTLLGSTFDSREIREIKDEIKDIQVVLRAMRKRHDRQE